MKEQQVVDEWNRKHPVGTPVIASKPLAEDMVEEVATRTRSTAQLLGGHLPVVWIEGFDQALQLEHVRPVSEGVIEDYEKCMKQIKNEASAPPMVRAINEIIMQILRAMVALNAARIVHQEDARDVAFKTIRDALDEARDLSANLLRGKFKGESIQLSPRPAEAHPEAPPEEMTAEK